MNVTRLSQLSRLVANYLRRKPTLVIEPKQPCRISGMADDVNITFDTDEWELPEDLMLYVDSIAKMDISTEEKIMIIYTKLCRDYTYDDNVLSYIKKNDDETFFLPDEYGRDTTKEWREKRKEHNRRICFEISRLLAKAIREMIRLNGLSNLYEVCILWDEAVTHYMVGLACDDYVLTLDLDDFNQIKDITRMKTDLTLEGIKILDDCDGKFASVLEEYNSNRAKLAQNHIEHKMFESEGISLDDISFIQFAIQILREEYDLDSAGIYEYIKEIVDTKIGTRARKKMWKEVKTVEGVGKRYTRCLIVEIDGVSYVVDVTKSNQMDIFRRLNESDFSDENCEFIPFKKMQRKWDEDPYDGR